MKILLIGAGGIGSFFLRTLYNAIGAGQLPATTEITVYDPDTVEEKNIRYQDYALDDIGFDKVEAMNIRWGVDGKCALVTPEVLNKEHADLVVCAVDNAQTRREVFAYWKRTGRYFIDMRAEGRVVSFFTPGDAAGLVTSEERETRYKELMDTLASAEEGSGSCQRAVDMQAGIIQMGNQIVAPIGVQLVLNRTRGTNNPASFIRRF